MPSMCLPVIIPHCLLVLPVTLKQFPSEAWRIFLECGNVGGQGRDSPIAPLKAENPKYEFKSYQKTEKTHTSEAPRSNDLTVGSISAGPAPEEMSQERVPHPRVSSSMCSLWCLIKSWAHTTASEPGLKAHQPNPLETNLQYLFNKWVWRTQPIYENLSTQIYSHLASWCCWDVLQDLSLQRNRIPKIQSHLLFKTWSIGVFIPKNLHRLKKLHNTEIPNGTSEIFHLLAWGSSKVTAEPQWSPIKCQLSEHTGRQNKGRGRDAEKQLINGKD